MGTDLQTQDFGLDNERQNALASRYNAVVSDLKTHIEAAKAITVASDTDTQGMQAARATRLALKAIRVNVENTRKALKEAPIREGKAIDGMANIIKYMIEPVEADLQAKEDFVRLAGERRKAELAAARAEKLSAFGVDCRFFDLANMAEEGFSALLSSSEAGYRAKIAAENAERARIEAERVAREKAEAERIEAERIERARIAAENAELRRKAEEERNERIKAEAKAQEERRERDRAEAESRRIAQEREESERKIKAEAERKQRAMREEAERKEREHMAALARLVVCPKCGAEFDGQANRKAL